MVCIRCQKRPAIIFVQRMENGQMKNEGYCLHCAREMHIKPVDDLMKQFGMSDEDIDTELEYFDSGDEQLYGDWIKVNTAGEPDDNGKYAPNPDGEFALIYDSNDGYGQLVYSKWVRYGRPASPCFPGQVDAREDDPSEPDGEPQYSVPTDQIFCMAPDRCCVPYYAFPQEAYE